jgi:hypothetical protein
VATARSGRFPTFDTGTPLVKGLFQYRRPTGIESTGKLSPAHRFGRHVRRSYPRDAAVVYLDRMLVQFRLLLESIRLWERHTREYVEEVKQGTA